MKPFCIDKQPFRAGGCLVILLAIGLGTALPGLGQVLHFDQLPPSTTVPGTNQNSSATPGASASPGSATAPAGTDANSAAGAAASTEPVAPVKPKIPDEVHPPGMAEAMKLYNAHKYAQAQKQFESFINKGIADEATHMNLAYCLYYQRKYSQALKQFDWVGTNAKHNFSMKFKAENTAGALRTYMRGICPGNCMKPNDPHWRPVPSLGNGLFYSFPMRGGGTKYFSEGHMGDVVQTVDGVPQDVGPCPICGGRGWITPLKDGMPPPGQ